MRALNRKLWRDLWEMRGMVLAIALVQVGGIATFVMSLSTYDSLLITRDSYYREHRFADAFASLKRAPGNLTGRIQDYPGKKFPGFFWMQWSARRGQVTLC